MGTIDISYRRIFRIAGPVLVTNFSYTAMGMIDTMMVGRLGVAALGAVGLANIVTFSVLSFFWGLLSGVNTLTAQAVGARDRVTVGRVFFQGLYLALLCGGVIATTALLVPEVLSWIHPPDSVGALAGGYMRVRLLGGWGVVLLWAADNFYRGLGRTTLTMWCGMTQLVLNCGLNYALIFGRLGAPALGVTGAALGTVLAQLAIGLFLAASVLFLQTPRRELEVWRQWRLRPSLFLGLVRLSLPIGAQTCLEMGGVTVFTALVSRLGEAQLAATNAVIQAWSVAFMGAFALSVGATTLVGQCVGAGEMLQAREVIRRVLRLGYLLMAAIGTLYVAMPKQLMALFVVADELPRLEPYARPLFAVVVACLIFDLEFNVLSGALRGAGDTTYSMLVNVASAWLVFVPALYVVTPRFGLVGAWSCFILHLVVMAWSLRLRVRGRRWLRPPRFRSSEQSADGLPQVAEAAALGDEPAA